MIRIFKVAFLVTFCLLSLVACHKDDSVSETPIVPYPEQNPIDMAKIEKYLDEYYMTVSSNSDVTFTKIPDNNPPVGSPGHIFSIRTQTEFPLQFKMVNANTVDYKIYYINISDAVAPYDNTFYGADKNPTRVDSAFVAYRGDYISNKTEEILPSTNPKTYKTFIANTKFDEAQNPVWFSLDQVIRGWREIVPLFKTGSAVPNSNGTVSYTGFGAGIMFIPSGLAYYSQGASTIPSYAPLIFTFKLHNLNYVDHDFDGIDSKDEDLNHNGIFSDDDTDGDGRQNYMDQDDDGDNILTKVEIRRPYIMVGGVSTYNGRYPYDGAAVDDPATPNIDETQGIPRKFTGPANPPTHPLPTPVAADFTDPARLRRYLDKTCFPPFE